MKKIIRVLFVVIMILMINQSPKASAQTTTIQMKIWKITDGKICKMADSLYQYTVSFHTPSTYHRMEWRNGDIVQFDTLSNSVHTLKIFSGNNKLEMTLYRIELDNNWYSLEDSRAQKKYSKILREAERQIKKEKWGRNVP